MRGWGRKSRGGGKEARTVDGEHLVVVDGHLGQAGLLQAGAAADGDAQRLAVHDEHIVRLELLHVGDGHGLVDGDVRVLLDVRRRDLDVAEGLDVGLRALEEQRRLERVELRVVHAVAMRVVDDVHVHRRRRRVADVLLLHLQGGLVQVMLSYVRRAHEDPLKMLEL